MMTFCKRIDLAISGQLFHSVFHVSKMAYSATAMCIAFFGTHGCKRGFESPPTHAANPLSSEARLSMLFAADLGLEGEPGLYELAIQAVPGAAPVVRSGDLPQSGQVLTLGQLPATESAEIYGGLYRGRIDANTKTHSCKADSPVRLVAGETATANLSCLAIGNSLAADPVRVFVKVAQASLNIKETSADAILSARDWSKPALFAAHEGKGRRVSLKQTKQALMVHVGGDLSYTLLQAAPASHQQHAPKTLSPLERLLAGDSLTLEATAGRLLTTAPEPATLRLTAPALLYENDHDGTLAAMLPLELMNSTSLIAFQGYFLEEPAANEFTIVSYNVENLFDQIDDERNASYADYRIAPNEVGQSSNWGEPVMIDGEASTWTAVKIAGIRQALTGIDPSGPEVVGLVEIESRTALDQLLDAVRDLGYTSAQFTDWTPGMPQTAVGLGIISKYPIRDWHLIPVTFNNVSDASAPSASSGSERPILRVTLDISGHPLTVYINHWKSKSGPESARLASAQALQNDIDVLLSSAPNVDYVIVGDLNSEHNEAAILEPRHNDTAGRTGINHVLYAQGDELAVAKGINASWKYNLHYELDRTARSTAWHEGFNWSGLDNMIVGSGVYDSLGVTYVDNSFQIANAAMPHLKFLFNTDGTTRRWRSIRTSGIYTQHEQGGYSDHVPLYARFHIARTQSRKTIWLEAPGRPNVDDKSPPKD